MRDYRKIKAWEFADDLTVMVYRRTKDFPKEEIYGITSQLRRAAYSVPSNVAEGSARSSNKDYLRFLYIARASLAETQYFVHLCGRLSYLDAKDAELLHKQIRATFARLHGLIEAVKRDTGRLPSIAAFITSSLAISLTRLLHRGIT